MKKEFDKTQEFEQHVQAKLDELANLLEAHDIPYIVVLQLGMRNTEDGYDSKKMLVACFESNHVEDPMRAALELVNDNSGQLYMFSQGILAAKQMNIQFEKNQAARFN